MDIVEQIAWRTIQLFAKEDASQIAHTQCVVSYTKLIAAKENYDNGRIELLTAAAWLHDIGCPAARAKYGNSKPVNQQTEGERIVREWAADYPEWSTSRWAEIAQIVGSHHQFAKAQEWHFEALFEADLIVNFFEGYYDRNNLKLYFEKMVTTPSGQDLFSKLFLE